MNLSLTNEIKRPINNLLWRVLGGSVNLSVLYSTAALTIDLVDHSIDDIGRLDYD